MDVYAFYFPQFYPIDENNLWWGEGFTDWDLVKKAQAITAEQYQPRRPIDDDYYDQSLQKTIAKQIALAEAHGLAGFNFYHYWFDGQLLLEKPLEHFRQSTGHQLNYCITWANESWTRQWVGKPDVLIGQSTSADRQIWRQHYQYLKSHFEQDNYLRVDAKPVLCIYRPEILSHRQAYMDFFDELAIADGFAGIHWVGMKSYDFATQNAVFERFDASIHFQPRDYFNHGGDRGKAMLGLESLLRALPETLQRPVARLKYLLQGQRSYNYIDFCQYLLEQAHILDQHEYQSILADWDNTARYGAKSKYFTHASPEQFERTLTQLLALGRSQHKAFMFINAWNEWSEGAYLEPDQKYGHAYLEALSRAIAQSD